jgi:hypothetical protein
MLTSNRKDVRLSNSAVKKAVADIWYSTRGTCGGGKHTA